MGSLNWSVTQLGMVGMVYKPQNSIQVRWLNNNAKNYTDIKNWVRLTQFHLPLGFAAAVMSQR